MESTDGKSGNGIKGRFLGQSKRQRFTTALGAVAVVIGLVVAGIGLAPQTNKTILTLGSEANQARPGVTDSKMAAGMMMPFIQYRYEVASNFSSEPVGTEVYRLKRAGDPKLTLAALAKQLGLKGEVTPLDENGWGPGNYYVGSSDWSGPTVTIGSTGMGSWSFNDPTAFPRCATTDTDGKDASCGTPEGTAAIPNFPRNEAAVEQARLIFAAGGLSVSESEIKIIKDDYSMSATASLEVAGAPTALIWQASWSSNGKLSYAYGQSVSIEKVTDVPVIDAKKAVERLGDWRWSGQAAESFYPQSPIAYGEPGQLRMGSTSDSSGSSSSGESGSGSAPAPTEVTSPPDDTSTEAPVEMPTPEVRTFLVNKATSALLLIWDSNGDAWLVPGYVFEGEDGFAGTVMAVADGVIKLPDLGDGVMPMVK